MHVHSFAPIVDHHCTTLILGTMPGKVSLAAAEYYAFERNAFWGIIEAQFPVERSTDYAQRKRALLSQRIAVWDVLKTCTRASSLDSAIVAESIVPNDFDEFFQQYPGIKRVFFNGACAEKLFLKQVKPFLKCADRLTFFRLPSTSPANARLSFADKLRAWSVIADVDME